MLHNRKLLVVATAILTALVLSFVGRAQSGMPSRSSHVSVTASAPLTSTQTGSAVALAIAVPDCSGNQALQFDAGVLVCASVGGASCLDGGVCYATSFTSTANGSATAPNVVVGSGAGWWYTSSAPNRMQMSLGSAAVGYWDKSAGGGASFTSAGGNAYLVWDDSGTGAKLYGAGSYIQVNSTQNLVFQFASNRTGLNVQTPSTGASNIQQWQRNTAVVSYVSPSGDFCIDGGTCLSGTATTADVAAIKTKATLNGYGQPALSDTTYTIQTHNASGPGTALKSFCATIAVVGSGTGTGINAYLYNPQDAGTMAAVTLNCTDAVGTVACDTAPNGSWTTGDNVQLQVRANCSTTRPAVNIDAPFVESY